jgi:hypothetical protein
MPIFSDVASAWISTIAACTTPPSDALFNTVSSALNGSSKGRFMNTCPSACVTSTLRPCVASNTREPLARRDLGEVQRPDDPRLLLDEAQHVLLVKGMVAQRQAIRPRRQQLLRMIAGQPRPLTGVLAIDHDEIQPPGRPQPRQPLGHRRPARPAHHIAKE